MSKISMIAAALVTALVASSFSAGAQAADPPAEQARGGGERFKAADTDGNGKLSKEEVSAAMPALAPRFDSLDTDKDGQLSGEEMRAARGGGRQKKE